MTAPALRTLVLPALLLLSACSRTTRYDVPLEPCSNHREIKDTVHLLDPKLLDNYAPELRDSVEKYPALQLNNITLAEHSVSANCNILSGGLRIYPYSVVFTKNTKTGAVTVAGQIPDTILLSRTPAVTPTRAIAVAHTATPLGIDCLAYRLIIYDAHKVTGAPARDYRLCRLVRKESGALSQVIVDAQNETVYAVTAE